MKEKKMAWLKWNDEDSRWILQLLIDGEWEFSRSWATKDTDDRSGFAWVNDAILCEIAFLQDSGYEVKVTV